MPSPSKGREARGKTKKPGPKRGAPSPTTVTDPGVPAISAEALSNEAANLLSEALVPRATPRDMRTPRDGPAALPERLLLGITLEGIHQILHSRASDAVAFAQTKAKRAFVDGYVNAVLCKQEALDDNLSTCERLKSSETDSCHVGSANVFVSWHFGASMDTLCDALMRYLCQEKLDATKTFFWISDFSLCQSKPLAPDLARLPDIIGAIGHTLMLLEPWVGSSMCSPLRRVYCQWELFHTARTGARFTPIMSSEQAEAFVRLLVDNVEPIVDVLTEVDVRTAKASASKERELIVAAVEGSIGADSFNALIGKLMRAAVADEARAAVNRLQPDERATLPAILQSSARLLHEAGDSGGAEPLYREALAALRNSVGERDDKCLGAMSTLASFLLDCDQVDEAEALMREELEVSRDVRGDGHPDTLTSINDLAVLLGDRGDYATAEPLYREALAGQRELLGDRHPSSILSMNNLASLLRARGEMPEAISLHSEALALQREVLGDRHTSTLASIYNLGSLLVECGDLERAEALLREELDACTEMLGSKHPDTLASAENMSSLLRAANLFNSKVDVASTEQAEVVAA